MERDPSTVTDMSVNPQEEASRVRAEGLERERELNAKKVVHVERSFGYNGRLITSATPAEELNQIPESFLAAQVATGYAIWADPEAHKDVVADPENPLPPEE